MEIKKTASCGTMESSDVMITVENGTGDVKIELESPVKKQFGEEIEEVVKECCERLGVKEANIKVLDKGALNCTIKARCETALYRACESKDYVWEVK